jgi:transposase InsO family protein
MPPPKPPDGGGDGQGRDVRSCHPWTPRDHDPNMPDLRSTVFEGARVSMAWAGLPNMIRAPVMIQGDGGIHEGGRSARRARAVIDTAAQRSLISTKFVADLGRTEDIQEPMGQKFLQAFDDTLVARLGTITLLVECGEYVNEVRFEVQNMEEDLLLGLDCLPSFGISVMGVPTQWPGQHAGLAAAQEAQRAESSLHSKKKVWALEDKVVSLDMDIILSHWTPEAMINRAIDPSQVACETISEATMSLPTPLGFTSFVRQYRMADAAVEPTNKQVLLWSASGYIEPGDPRSEWNSALVAVSKKNSAGVRTAWRICEDFRRINSALTDRGFDNNRMPLLSDVLARVRGFTYASSLDLSAAYHQLAIDEKDRHKTSFTWQGKKWQWSRWPFGLTPATVQFQKVMEIVMDGLDCVILWVDDILVFSNGSADEHGKLLAEVMRRLNKHNLRLNVDKCHIGFRKVLLLGHYLSGGERSVDPLKANQALAWPEPVCGKDIERFLGFTNYVRDYVPMYAEMAAPLEALRKVKSFVMTTRERKSFESLVQSINSSPVLKVPDPSLMYEVATDASQTGMGAILYQVEVSGERRYIAFASKSLNGAQKNYSATKRELLGIVFALHQFHEYLWGNKFVLYTDHKALTALHTKDDLSYVMKDWLNVILRYSFECRHRPGVEMVLPDAISRMYTEAKMQNQNAILKLASRMDSGSPQPRVACVLATALSKRSATISEQHRLAELEGFGLDEFWEHAPMVASVGWGVLPEREATPRVCASQHPVVIDELIPRPDQALGEFVRERLQKEFIADHDARKRILNIAHLHNHFGAETLFKDVWRLGYYWPGLKKQCAEVVSTCRTCLQYNVKREGFHPTKSLRAEHVWDHIAIDCAVALPASANGYKNMLIIVDVLSRFVITKPLKSMEGAEIARALYEVFALFGPPKAMQSDNGTEFINKIVKQLTRAAGVDHRLVVAWNPRANGLAERMVKMVKDLLKKKLAGVWERWDEALPGVTFAINTKDAALSRTAPFTIFLGRSANAWQDYTIGELQLAVGDQEESRLEMLREQNELHELMAEEVLPAMQDSMRERQDAGNVRLDAKRKLMPDFPTGALVMAKVPDRASKLEPLYVGPFMVVRKSKRSATYTLRDLDNKVLPRTFAVSQLKFVADTRVPLLSADGEMMQEAEHAEVAEILDHRETDGSTQFLVRWKDQQSANSWLSAADFDDPAMPTAYFRSRNKGGRKRGRKESPAPVRRSKRRKGEKN